MKVFIDTGPLCAATLSGDLHNAGAKEIFLSMTEQNFRLFTSNFILDELYTLLNARSGHRTAVNFK